MTIRQLPRLKREPEPKDILTWADRFTEVITAILNAPLQNGLVGLDQLQGAALASGSLRLPSTANPLVLAWGTGSIAAASTTATVTFPTAFPQNCWQVVLSQTGTGGPFAVAASALTRTGFTATAGNGGMACSFSYLAIGN